MSEVDPELRPRTYDTDCLFCAAAHAKAAELPWYLRPTYRDPICMVLPGVGSLTSVYAQVAPVRHLPASRAVPDRDQAHFSAVVEAVAGAVQAACGGVTVFEHGGTSDRVARRSACIDHAHVHVLAGSFSFAAELPEAASHDSFGAFLSGRDGLLPYLMYRTGSGPVRVATDIGESQFFRRRIAAQLGVRERWDWAVFPHWEHVRETIDFLIRLTWADNSPIPAGLAGGSGCGSDVAGGRALP